MLKKLGIPALAIAGMLAFATPHAAKAAGVRFGFSVGNPYIYSPYAYGYPYYGYGYPYAFGWGGYHSGHHHHWHGGRHHR